MGKIENLPKWAQQEISRLEADKEYWRDKARGSYEEVDRSREISHATVLNIDYVHSVLMPSDTVEFYFQKAEECITIRRDKDSLDVNSSGRSLVIKPGSSNAVKLKLEK